MFAYAYSPVTDLISSTLQDKTQTYFTLLKIKPFLSLKEDMAFLAIISSNSY